jgi:FkbM family methyltransferase
MQNFRKQYATNSSIILVEKAVTDLTGRATLFSSGGDAVSSLDESHKIKWEAGSNVKFSPVEVETISLSSLLADHLENVDFLTIDVESTNLFLFDRLTDVVFESVKLICIEHDGHSDHIKNRCNNFGFKQLLLNGENIILGK